jgi:hypothetical protein
MSIQFKQIGETIICPHQDGDYQLSVHDLWGWSTGSCLIVQEGQHERHSMVVSKEEAGRLAAILKSFSES